MLKANIAMNDGTVLRDVLLFKSKKMDDTMIDSKEEAEEYINGHKITFFGGKYVQGSFISEQVAQYELYTDIKDIEKKLQKFIERNSGIWDLEDTCEFIMEHRSELLKILK